MNIKIQTQLNINFKQLVLLSVSLLVFINVVFFKYVWKNVVEERKRLKIECNKTYTLVGEKLNGINSKLYLFEKISSLEKEIDKQKKELKLLKKREFSAVDVSKILDTLLLKSGVNVESVQLLNLKKSNEKIEYSFKVTVMDSLQRIVKMLGIIENYGYNVYIPYYSLTYKGNGIFDIVFNVNFVYAEIE